MEPFVLHGPSAATLEPGTWLLEASAGTGKTYTIVGIVIRLVVEHGVPIERCVVMTFTRAATAELRERLRRGLHQALAAIDGEATDDAFLADLASRHHADPEARRRLLMAIAGLDAALIATIHGVCHRLLGDHALHAGITLDAELEADLSQWREQTVHDLLRDWTRRLSPAGASIVGAALDPATALAACQRIERQPEVVLTGSEPIGPAAVEQRLAVARECWDVWRDEITAFYTARLAILGAGTVYNPKSLAAHLARLGAVLASLTDGEELIDLLRPILNPNHEQQRLGREHVKALQATAWFQGLAALVAVEPGVRRHLVEGYRVRLRQRPLLAHHLHFQDLLTALDAALHGDQGQALRAAVAERYDVVLVDEFQDTDPLQWRILRGLFTGPRKRLFLIGDPKQAIYAFRGADVHAYLEVAGLPGLRRATLGANYRSDQPLVAAINHCFDRGPATFVTEAIAFRPVAAVQPSRIRLPSFDPRPLQLWWQGAQRSVAETREEIAHAVAVEIQNLLSNTAQIHRDGEWVELTAPDIAVLVRSHHEGDLVADALAKLPQRIATARNIRESVFASRTATEVVALLTAILAPHRERSVRTCAITRLGGLTAADLIADDAPALEGLMARLRELRALWIDHGFLTAWQQVLDHGVGTESPRVLLARGHDGERGLTDLLHLGDLLGAAEADLRLGPDALLDWLQRRVAGEDAAQDDQLLRIDRDDDAVRILTIHTSKGLEFPVVFAPFLWQGSLPDPDQLYHDGHVAQWFFGHKVPTTITQAQQRDVLAETMRLAYVAMTRAAHRCYLAFAPQPARGSGAGCTTSALTWLGAGVAHGDPQAVVDFPVADPGWQERLRQAFAHPEIAISGTPQPSSIPLRLHSDRDHHSERPVAPWAPRWRERRFSSYSGLVRNRPVDEPDHDQMRSEDPEPVGEDRLPRGARFGSALHQVFETVDFAAPVETYYSVCAEALRSQGFGDDQAVRLGLLVDRVLGSPLPDGTPLREAAASRQCELEVLLPVTQHSPDGLARAFAEHGGPWTAYADDIADIQLPQGYFTGIIDLLFTHRDRVHLLDWKSNDLRKRGGYDDAAMRAEMRHHHYVLQYHLYTLALHRYLQRRLTGYTYERHVGSAHYLFVRGVDGSGQGWYQHRPSAAMIAALDGCFGRIERG